MHSAKVKNITECYKHDQMTDDKVVWHVPSWL
jgi:hypothetical protein